MQSTKSRWSVVCGFSGESYSGHRTEDMANKKADEIRKSLWWPNVTGKLWDRECALRRLRAGDPRFPEITGKYRHSCGSLASYVQVVPAGSYFDEARWVIPTAGEDRDGLNVVPDLEAAARARIVYEAEEAERNRDLDDVRSDIPLPEHLVAVLRRAEAAEDADIPLAEGHIDE